MIKVPGQVVGRNELLNLCRLLNLSDDQLLHSFKFMLARLVHVPPHYWRPPKHLHNISTHDFNTMGYKIGYLNMMRFWGLFIFRMVKELGYDWIMREDDDSEINSPIEYDIVQFMIGEPQIAPLLNRISLTLLLQTKAWITVLELAQ